MDETLIPILEEGLQKTRDVQRRLIGRLQEAEAEVERLRLEISALEESATQTEKSITNLVIASRSGGRPASLHMDDGAHSIGLSGGERKVADISTVRSFTRGGKVAYLHSARSIPTISSHNEPVSRRFSDRTIIQACTLLLGEADQAMHVNELYNLLVAGGMKFKGKNPTISIAVSLSRSPRFMKVGPGTFHLDYSEGLKAAS